MIATAGCTVEEARALIAGAAPPHGRLAPGLTVEGLGRDGEGPRVAMISTARPVSAGTLRRVRTIGAVLRQGFDLCSARERPVEVAGGPAERQLEPLFPGFLCASAGMHRVTEQIQRLQGNDLTVLITGESGTGKDLVARAIHAGSARQGSVFLPYNCTSATRELADSQLFGHRRGSFTGAVADQPGVLRTAVGGTLFLDEVGDLPLDVQPKLLRFLEQGEVLPVGDTRPQRVDVRVVAATNADLEQRVADGKFREDLVLPPERHPDSRSAAARPPRGDPALEHVFPARGLRAAGKTRGASQPGNARSVRRLRLARQRAATAQRSAARGGHGRRGRRDHAGLVVAGLRARPRPGRRASQGPHQPVPRLLRQLENWNGR